MQTKRKAAKPHKRIHRRSPKKAQPEIVTTTAIVSAAPPKSIRRGFTRDQIDLLKRQVAKGASDDQFALFLNICERHRLDPFAKQVYCVFFKEEMVVITGINGYRTIAARDHKDYAGSSEGQFQWGTRKTPAGRKIPDVCTMEIYAQTEPRITRVSVQWDEFAPGDLTTTKAQFWNRMPSHMLAKCCEAFGLKKRFPSLGDIEVDAALDQRREQFTDGGRQIVNSQGFDSTGTAITHQAQNRSIRESQELPLHHTTIEAQKLDAALVSMTDPDEIVKTFGLERSVAEEVAAKNKRRKETIKTEICGDEKMIEWDWNGPVIRSDADTIPVLQKYCPTMQWKNQTWQVSPADYAAAKALAEYTGCRFVEIEAKQRTIKPKETKEVQPKEPPKKANASTPKKTVAEPTLITGTIQRVNSGMTSKNNPTRQVKLDNTWLTSYVNPIFPFLDKGLGKQAILWIDARHNIVGIKKIGSQEFDVDGRTPTVSVHREPGRTLFND